VTPEVTTKATKSRKIEGADDEDDDAFQTVGKGGRVLQFTSENVFKELQHVQEARGKKVIVILGSRFHVVDISHLEHRQD